MEKSQAKKKLGVETGLANRENAESKTAFVKDLFRDNFSQDNCSL
jgi:hypothetical protein